MKVATAVLALALSVSAVAAAQPVGLGVGAGIALPHGEATELVSESLEASFAWGYYVNIPLVSTFHVVPSTTLYLLNGENATDLDLAFKFIIPLGDLSLYAGLSPGLTTVSETTAPHLGILGGTSFRLLSNVDLFVDGVYSFLFAEAGSARVFRISAGALFRFQ
jgi:hypothetical protein